MAITSRSEEPRTARELRDATLGYLLRAAVIDTYQGLLDAVYPQWRAELMAEPDAPGAEPA